MKQIISEQAINVRRLKGDTKWEYGLKNGLWHARKQDGSGDWISIDILDPDANPKVKNPKAVDILNKAFPNDAKLRGSMESKGVKTQPAATTTTQTQPTPTTAKSKKLPTDFSKSITFWFPDKSTITVTPKFANMSKSIITSIGLGDRSDLGNTIVLPAGSISKKCPNKDVTIFTPEVISSNKLSQNDIENWCAYDNNAPIKKTLQNYTLPQQAWGAAPSYYSSEKIGESSLKSLIKKILHEETESKLSLKKNIEVSKDLQYHIENNIPISENVFRIYSTKYFDLINEVRDLYEKDLIALNNNDKWLVESDLGKRVKLSNGDVVYLDAPIYENDIDEVLTEAEHRGKKVKLNSPFRTPGALKNLLFMLKLQKVPLKK